MVKEEVGNGLVATGIFKSCLLTMAVRVKATSLFKVEVRTYVKSFKA